MPKPTATRGSGANIMRQGHTASPDFGTNPDAKRRTSTAVRDLNAK